MMKFFTKLLVLPVVLLAMVSCGDKETYTYSVSNALNLTESMADNFAVMNYAETHVKMGVESVMTFTDSQADADKSAKAEFAKRMKAINEAEFRGMMKEGDNYDFILSRASNEPNGAVEIDRKSFKGTKKR